MPKPLPKPGVTPILRSIAACLFALLASAPPATSGTHTDPVTGFAVTTPDSWISESVKDGTDHVVSFTSPEGLAHGEIRAFHLSEPTNATELRKDFGQTVLPGAKLMGTEPDILAGLSGQLAAWTTQSEGQDIVVGGFFAVDGPVGYILMTVTVADSFSTYSDLYDDVFATFVPGTILKDYAIREADQRNTPPPAAQPPVIDRTGTALHAGLIAQAHPELGFVIVHNDSWEADQPAPYSVRIGPREVPRPQRPSITIEALSGNAYGSLQAFAEDLKTQLSGEPGIRFDQEGPHRIDTLEVNGTPLAGWSFGATFGAQEPMTRIIYYLFERRDPHIYYGVYATGHPEKLARFQPDMMRILATFQMIPFGDPVGE